MNRVQEVQKLYPKFATAALRVADSQHKNKYLKWIAAQLERKHNASDIKATIAAFNKDSKRLKYSDIYKYKDLKELEDELKNLSISNRQMSVLGKEQGSVKIYSDDFCSLIRINSKIPLLYYGKGSQWCITMEDESYWEEYSANGNIFYILIDNSNNKKYIVQKYGFSDMTIWTVNDSAIPINTWLKTHSKFEHVLFKCLKDREPSMMSAMMDRTINRETFLKWIEYQHPNTIDFLKYKSRYVYYTLDTTKEVSKQTIVDCNKLSLEDLKQLHTENPNYIHRVTMFLHNNPTMAKQLRKKLVSIISDPALLLTETEIKLIKSKTDPNFTIQLLQSDEKNIWQRVLKNSSPDLVFSILNSIEPKSKKSKFIDYIIDNMHLENVIKWLSQLPQTEIPNDIWKKPRIRTAGL